MNLPGRIIEAIKLESEREWDVVFDSLAKEKAMEIEGRDDLTNLKAEIKQIRAMQNWFKEQRNRT